MNRAANREGAAVYFATRASLRDWFARKHSAARELWVGFHKKKSGVPSVTYPEALDEALCVGWIDGVRKRVDEDRYVIRFTPRRPGSYWSAVNTRRAIALQKAGLMTAAGLAAFQARDPEKTRQYSFERAAATFPPELERTFRASPKAWEYFQRQPPSYRKTLTWWVVSAVKEETRRSRLDRLIRASATGRRVQ